MQPPYPHYPFPFLPSNPQRSLSGWPTAPQMPPSSSTDGYRPNLAPGWASSPYSYPSYAEWTAQQPQDPLRRASYGNNVASSSTEGQALHFQHQQHMQQQQQQPPPHSAPYPHTSPRPSYSFPPSAFPPNHPHPQPHPAHPLPPLRPDAWSPTFLSAFSSPPLPQAGPSSSTFAPSPTPTPAFPLPSTRQVAEEEVQPLGDESVGSSAGLVQGEEVGEAEREEDVGRSDPEEKAQQGEQSVEEQEKESGEEEVEVDELEESSSEDEPLAATTANVARFSVNAAKERPAFDAQVAPVYTPKTYSWVVKTDSPYLKKLVNARESLFKAQRKLHNARLEDSSYEAVAAKVSTYARSKNSRFSNIALAVRRYICFCYTVDIPPWPLTPPLAALALSAVGTTKKTVGSRKQEVKQLRAITRAVAPLWSDMPGVQQLQSYTGAETALKEWVNAGSPSKTRDAAQSQACPDILPSPDEALTGKGKEKALEKDDPPTPPSDSDEELEPPEELVKRWAAEKAQRAKKPPPSSTSTQAAERTPSLPPQEKTPPLPRHRKTVSKPVLDFDFTSDTDSEAEEEEVQETPKASFSKRHSVDLEQPSPPRKRMLFREDSSFGLEETDHKVRSSLTPTPASPSPRPASPSPQPAHFSPAPVLPLVVFDEVDDEPNPAPVVGNEAPPVNIELEIPSPLPFNPPIQFSLLDFLTTLAPPRYRLRDHFLHLFVGIRIKTVEALAAQKEDQENMLLDLRREAHVQGTDASERDWWALELKLSEWYATLPQVKKEAEEDG